MRISRNLQATPATATSTAGEPRPARGSWRWAILFPAAALCMAAYHRAQAGVAASAAPALPPAPVELKLSPFIGDVKTVDVGGGPAAPPYVFDTGGGLTVVTPDETRRLGCEPFGRVTGFRANGERLDMPRCGPVRLQLGGLIVEDEAAVLDVNLLVGNNAPKIGGLVTLKTLHDRAFTLDIAHNRVILESAASLAHRIKGLRQMEVRPEMEGGGASLDLFVAVHTPKGKIWLELDSGNTGPVRLAPHAIAQLGLTPESLTHGKIDLDFVGLGKIPVTASEEKDYVYDGILNGETIAGFTLTIDLRSLEMWGALAAPAPAIPHAAP
jgi:hypothetical protein